MYLFYSILTVPAILNEAIPSATRTVEDSLNTCHVLAHCYTALLESMHEDQQRHRQLSSFKLKEALFNVRQYEAFLCILMVRQHLAGFKKKIQKSLKSDFSQNMRTYITCYAELCT